MRRLPRWNLNNSFAIGLLLSIVIVEAASANCFDDKLNQLRGDGIPFTSPPDGVRSGTCGGCCTLGRCRPPSDRKPIRYSAPPGYIIEGPVNVNPDGSNGQGGYSDVTLFNMTLVTILRTWSRTGTISLAAWPRGFSRSLNHPGRFVHGWFHELRGSAGSSEGLAFLGPEACCISR